MTEFLRAEKFSFGKTRIAEVKQQQKTNVVCVKILIVIILVAGYYFIRRVEDRFRQSEKLKIISRTILFLDEAHHPSGSNFCSCYVVQRTKITNKCCMKSTRCDCHR